MRWDDEWIRSLQVKSARWETRTDWKPTCTLYALDACKLGRVDSTHIAVCNVRDPLVSSISGVNSAGRIRFALIPALKRPEFTLTFATAKKVNSRSAHAEMIFPRAHSWLQESPKSSTHDDLDVRVPRCAADSGSRVHHWIRFGTEAFMWALVHWGIGLHWATQQTGLPTSEVITD